MQKGKFGFKLWVYPVVAMAFFVLDQFFLGALAVGFAIAAEKNEWVSHQVLQVLIFGTFAGIANMVVDGIDWLFGLGSGIPMIAVAGGVVCGILYAAIFVFLVVFYVLGFTRVIKGKDAKLPIACTIANHAFGIVAARPQPPVQPQKQYQVPPYQAPQAPMQQPQQPQNPQYPQQ
ncbi:MAG: hypothetical protein ACLU62_14330 [Hydrogeniiclostridium sp.]